MTRFGLAAKHARKTHGRIEIYRMNKEQVARGMLLRRRRQEKNLTLRELAELTGLSTGFLSKIENGIGNPSADNIQKIGYALGITINELMENTQNLRHISPATGKPSYILRKNERSLLYDFANMVRFESLLDESPNFKVNVYTLFGGSGEHYSSMHNYDEFGVVMKGTLGIQFEGEEEQTLGEGDCIMIRARTRHDMIAVSSEECVSVWVEITESTI